MDNANFNVGFQFTNFSCGEYVMAESFLDAIGKAFTEIYLKGFTERGGALISIHVWQKCADGEWRGVIG